MVFRALVLLVQAAVLAATVTGSVLVVGWLLLALPQTDPAAGPTIPEQRPREDAPEAAPTPPAVSSEDRPDTAPGRPAAAAADPAPPASAEIPAPAAANGESAAEPAGATDPAPPAVASDPSPPAATAGGTPPPADPGPAPDPDALPSLAAPDGNTTGDFGLLSITGNGETGTGGFDRGQVRIRRGGVVEN